MQETKTKQRHYVHKKLLRKVYIYVGIFFAMLIVSLYDVLQQYINPFEACLGWGLGILIGYGSGRMSKILWHEDSGAIIAQRDVKGIIILVLYIGFSLSRRWVLGHWVQGTLLSAFIFCMIAGTRLGRIISIRRKIKRVLREQGII